MQAVLAQRAHSAGEALYGTLRRSVWRDALSRQLTLHRRHVDDVAAASWDHSARDGLTDVEGTRNVCRQQLLPHIARVVLQRCPKLHSGVVDEDANWPDLLLDRRDGGIDGAGICDVEAGRFRAGNGPCGLPQLPLVPAIQHDPRALVGETQPGDPIPDSGSDQGYAVRMSIWIACQVR